MLRKLFQSNKVIQYLLGRQTQKRINIFLRMVIYLFILMPIQSVSSEVPELISIQGRLTDASGVNKPDGSYTLKFAIYDSATFGSMKWGLEVHTSVSVKNGIFQLFLGESITGIRNIFSETNLWLEITVIKDGVEEILIPRQRLVSVGYAFRSEIADTVKDDPTPENCTS
ncbi:MAG: hypothetical protein A2551_07685 [Elusimicrobia bacterium RIFOXYD2_FULL_34_30]|nr:MAG: hypothetical protein A2551_07685 [Elusimicrobia bacterium RIFOXYD2_FULL_34_30]